jgi:hypothetical protein
LSKILLKLGLDYNIERDLTDSELINLLLEEKKGSGERWISDAAMRYIGDQKIYQDYFHSVKTSSYLKAML